MFFGSITVYEYERGVLLRKGKIERVLGAGRYMLWSDRTKIVKLDMRSNVVTVPGQEVLTADAVPVRLTLLITFRIEDPVKYLTKSADPMAAAYAEAQAAIRKLVQSKPVDDLLASRGDMDAQIGEMAIGAMTDLGVVVENLVIKDITFPGELKSVMTEVVRAQKAALASLERARGESAALRHLANAAKMFENNPGLMQLRILQTLGESKGNTVILNAGGGDTLPTVIRDAFKGMGPR